MLETAQKLMLIFKGRESVRGVMKPSNTIRQSDGKRDAKYAMKHEIYTLEHWIAHVEGIEGLGLVPIMEDNRCYWGAIDVDVYQGFDRVQFLKDIKQYEFPLTVFESKSGGLHCYLLVDEKVTARAMRQLVSEMSRQLGPSKVDIFPRQDEIINKEELGSFLNMPYFNLDSRMCIQLDEDNESVVTLSIDEFLSTEHTITREQFESLYTKLIAHNMDSPEDGSLSAGMPPCLKTLIKRGVKHGFRDEFFYNIAVFLKKRYGEVDVDKMMEYNQMCVDELDYKDCAKIAHSVNKRETYQYKCHSELLNPFCNQKKCIGATYGIPVGEAVPKARKLVKINNPEEPVYILYMTDDKALFLEPDQLSESRLFKKAMLHQHNCIMPNVTSQAWDEYLRPLMENITIQEPSEDVSLVGMIKDSLHSFISDNIDEDRECLLYSNGVYFNKEVSTVYFQLNDLRSYLISKKLINNTFSKMKLANILEGPAFNIDKAVIRVGRTTKACRTYPILEDEFDIFSNEHEPKENII